ncbi:hypothetical protein C8Q75DRAFT_164637 [Abortiporus biennis]|nr:hypothetical protein C8Q75DRAFT_164637 [Abortiporus biennis]
MGNYLSGFRHSTKDYIPLHTSDQNIPNAPSNRVGTSIRFFLARFWKLGFGVLVLLLLGSWVAHRRGYWEVDDGPHDPEFPPLYSEYHVKELALPQHNPNLPIPEGKDGKYLWIANHVDGLGWGNYMQEYMLDSYITYKTGRINVFDNYTWDRYGQDYAYHDGIKVPSRVPLSAILAGPLVGGPWKVGDKTPRTVLVDYYRQICPNPTVIDPREVDSKLPSDIPADKLVEAWVDVINAMPDQCIEIQRGAVQLFSFWIFGEAKRLLPVWPEYKVSPIIQQFRWSPLVENAFDTNIKLFSSSWRDKISYPYTTVPGLLALHIRRGDYEGHCNSLSDWGSNWNGFNLFPEFPDQWRTPSGCGGGNTTSECRLAYAKACYPTIEQIVEKVEIVRASAAGQGLKRIFIMTNGDNEWVGQLKEAFMKAYKWDGITSTWDVKLNWEQTYINQAVDMLIGQRAQVLIGNGWSSLTSNVIMLRQARDVPADSNRFW